MSISWSKIEVIVLLSLSVLFLIGVLYSCCIFTLLTYVYKPGASSHILTVPICKCCQKSPTWYAYLKYVIILYQTQLYKYLLQASLPSIINLGYMGRTCKTEYESFNLTLWYPPQVQNGLSHELLHDRIIPMTRSSSACPLHSNFLVCIKNNPYFLRIKP